MWRLDWYTVPESAGLKSVRGHRLFSTERQALNEQAYMRATRPELRFTGPYQVNRANQQVTPQVAT